MLSVLGNEIQVAKDITISAKKVIEELSPLLTEERKSKIDKVVQNRCQSVSVVMENIYDRGNVSAVMRSMEAFGFIDGHLVELGEKFKEANRVTAGADKWVELTKWKSTKECVDSLKRQGKKIIVTHLSDKARPISEFDFSSPCAIVLGNEKDGISQEMLRASDAQLILPMVGFVQSYNISVAAALCLYHIYQDRVARMGCNSDLNNEQIDALKAHYYLRTQDSGYDYLKEKAMRGLI